MKPSVETEVKLALAEKRKKQIDQKQIAAVQMNDDIDMIHIGYCLGNTWWHQGVMSEALKAAMDFFFDKVGAKKNASHLTEKSI